MKEKIADAFFKLKSYWKKPPIGYQVSYKEFLNLTLGFGGISFMSILVQWSTLAMNIPMMISYFKASTGLIFILGLVASVIGLVRAPILSMIIDNSNSKKGKFKPFLIWTSVASGLCFVVIPFIPQEWTERVLFKFTVPDLPLFGVASSQVDFSLGILVMFVMLQIGSTFYTLLTQSMTGIEQTISNVAQERANIGALKGLVSNIPGSIVNIILPIVAGAFFAVGSTTGMNNILLYRFSFPICMVGGILLILFTVRGTTERIVVNQKYVAKVRFIDGAKELSKNKYFWILLLFSITIGIRNVANINYWVCAYGIGGKAGDTAFAVCNMVLNNAFIPGMIFGPMLVKKFGKRNVLVVANVGFTLSVLAQLLFIRNPYLILVTIFFQNLFNGVGFMATIMVSDVLDFQQWKSGKRLEGFWQNYNVFIMTFVGIFTGVLSPLFLSFGGIKFGDVIDTAMKDPALMNGAFKYMTILGILGSVVAMIPMFFYDLTEKKHANYVRVLKIRAAVDNYNEKVLLDEDVLNTKEIVEYAAEKKDQFLFEELKKYSCLNAITADHEEVAARVEANRLEGEAADKRRADELLQKKNEAKQAKLDHKKK